jgi:hypothetical protein
VTADGLGRWFGFGCRFKGGSLLLHRGSSDTESQRNRGPDLVYIQQFRKISPATCFLFEYVSTDDWDSAHWDVCFSLSKIKSIFFFFFIFLTLLSMTKFLA